MQVTKNQHTYISAMLVPVVLFLSFFGMFFCSQMMMNMGHSATMKSDCAETMPSEQDCPMDIAEHLSAWSLLKSAVQGDTVLGLMTLVSLGFFVALFVVSPVVVSVLSKRLHLRNHSRFKLFDYFIELFSQGILAPKLFA